MIPPISTDLTTVYFAAVEEVLDPVTHEYVPERTYGCLPADEKGLMQCKGHLVPHFEPRNIACCSDRALCNQDLAPMYQPTRDSAAGAGDQLDPSVYHVSEKTFANYGQLWPTTLPTIANCRLPCW